MVFRPFTRHGGLFGRKSRNQEPPHLAELFIFSGRRSVDMPGDNMKYRARRRLLPVSPRESDTAGRLRSTRGRLMPWSCEKKILAWLDCPPRVKWPLTTSRSRKPKRPSTSFYRFQTEESHLTTAAASGHPLSTAFAKRSHTTRPKLGQLKTTKANKRIPRNSSECASVQRRGVVGVKIDIFLLPAMNKPTGVGVDIYLVDPRSG